MSVDLDPEKIITTTGGGAFGIAALWYWIKNMKRKDNKGEVIDNTWIELVNQLRDEVRELKAEVGDLRKKVMECENERLKAEISRLQFEKRYGPLKEEEYENRSPN